MRTLDAMLVDPQMKPLRRTISTWFKLLLRRKVAVALQLQLRFGALPDLAKERLGFASEEQLTQWLGAILTAKSIDDLFGTEGPVH